MSYGIVASSAVGNGGGGSTSSAFAALVLASSPLMYWRMNDTSGTTVTDSSGNDRHGLCQDSPSFDALPLVIEDDGTSMYFSGSQTEHVVRTAEAWMNVSDLTVSCAVFLDPGVMGLQMFVSRYHDDDNDRSFFLYAENGEFKFYYRGVGGQEVTINSGVTAAFGQIYYVSAYCGAAGSGIRVYYQGTLAGASTGAGYSLNPSSRPLIVGGADQTAYHMTGTLQEVSYYGTILPTTTIDAHAALATAPQPKWINRAAGVGARNGTSDHTLTFAPAAAGSLLVAVVNGAVTSTAVSAGWTKRLAALDNAELAVFTRSANAGDSSLQLTHNDSNYPINYVVYEFPPGSTYVTGDSVDIGNTPPISGLSGSPTVVMSALSQWSSSPGDTVSMTWGYAWIEDIDVMTAGDGVTSGAHLGLGYRGHVTSTGIDPSTEGFYGPVYQVSNIIVGISGVTFAIELP